jgi:hypothetical protein
MISLAERMMTQILSNSPSVNSSCAKVRALRTAAQSMLQPSIRPLKER